MRFFVTGTDTDVGKTVAAAWAILHMNAHYWKPVQCGTEGGTDPDRVQLIAGVGTDRILPSAYVLPEPLSPHEAAKRAGVEISLDTLALPQHEGPLVVEGAGGLLVPLNDKHYVIDLIAQLRLPVILVCRSQLGTINHTLLSLEALRKRYIPIAGVVINGPKMPHNREAIQQFGRVKVLAEIPYLDPLDAASLRNVAPEVDLAGL